MLVYPNERTVMLIDGPNQHNAMKQLGWDLDFARFKNHFVTKCHLLRCIYYTAVVADRFDGLHSLLDYLDYNGFTVVTKPVKTMNAHDAENATQKGNMDVDIAVDAMKIAANVDHIMLFTGDGDFVPLVEALQEMGKRVTVIGTMKVKVTAADLRRAADNFVEIDELKASCARDPQARVRAGLERRSDNAAAQNGNA